MRDFKRIKRICQVLEKKWSKVPDQRLGQFLENYVCGHHIGRSECIFYIEDDIVEDRLKKLGYVDKYDVSQDLTNPKGG